MRSFLIALETVFDHSQPQRPWGELFSEGFAPPIRENWQFRLVVNLVWFARNYLNFVVATTFAVSYWFPGFLVTVIVTLFVHADWGKRHRHTRMALQAGQLASLAANNCLYGWLSGFLYSVTIALIILTHAVFAIYTDERVKRYRECVNKSAQKIKTGCEDFAPRTPVISYTGTGKGNFPIVEPDSLPFAEASASIDAGMPSQSRSRKTTPVDADMPSKSKEQPPTLPPAGNTPAHHGPIGLRRRNGMRNGRAGTVIRNSAGVPGPAASRSSNASSLPLASSVHADMCRRPSPVTPIAAPPSPVLPVTPE